MGRHKKLTNNKQTPEPTTFNRVARFVACGAVAIEPLYSAFLWGNVTNAMEEALSMMGIDELSSGAKHVVQAGTFILALGNLACDLASVHPMKEADELSYDTPVVPVLNKANGSAVMEGSCCNKEKISRYLNTFLKAIAITMVFPVGAAADAIPIAELTDAIQNIVLRGAINYSSLATVTLLGVAYYVMFNSSKIDKHTKAAENLSVTEFVYSFAKNPAKYIEVIIQCLSNTAYRSLSFMFILGDVLKTLFGVQERSTLSKSMQIGEFTVHIPVILFTRTLSVYDTFLSKELVKVSPEQYLENDQRLKKMVPASIAALVRAGSAAMLCIGLTPSLEIGSYFLGVGVGLSVLAHGLYVKYHLIRQQAVLAMRNSGNQANPQDAQKPSLAGALVHVGSSNDNAARCSENQRLVSSRRSSVGSSVSNHSTSSRVSSLNASYIGSEPVVSSATIPQETALEEKSAFQQIKEIHNQLLEKVELGKAGTIALELINIISRLARFIGFFSFVHSLNDTFELELSPMAMLAFAFLFGAEVFKADRTVFFDSILEVLKIIVLQMLAREEEVRAASTNSEISTTSSRSFRVGNFFRNLPIVRSPYDYGVATWKAVQRRLDPASAKDSSSNYLPQTNYGTMDPPDSSAFLPV